MKQLSDKMIISYDGICFSGHTLQEIDKYILSQSKNPIINIHTGRPFPQEFVQKMRKRYSSRQSEPEKSVTPNILDFRKKNYGVEDDYLSGEEKGDVDEMTDENKDMSSEEEEDLEEERKRIAEAVNEDDDDDFSEYIKVDIGPINIVSLNKEIIRGNITVVFFYTDWCQFCQLLDKPWEEFKAEKTRHLRFLKVNRDYAEEIAKKYDIKKIPSFLLLKRKDNSDIEVIDLLSGPRIRELRTIIYENLKEI